MSQKINPISLRLQQTNRFFDSCWYSNNYYTELVCRDIKMQMYLNSILKQLNYPTARLFIQNIPKKLKISIFYFDPRNHEKTNVTFLIYQIIYDKLKKIYLYLQKIQRKEIHYFLKLNFFLFFFLLGKLEKKKK